MLAEQGGSKIWSGKLDHTIQLSEIWRLSLVSFIANELPNWRDDSCRPSEKAETILTSQLCAYMNSITRMSQGWDFLQFRTEEPDEIIRSRRVDLVPAPLGVTIWIEGREYSQYASLMPIECKRLPTPSGSARDEREYLFSTYSSTGGVQRFKAGYHGAAHSMGAMIGYIQDHDVEYWTWKIQRWLNDLVADKISGWRKEDALSIASCNKEERAAIFESIHSRSDKLPPIKLFHLWIDMTAPLATDNK